MTTTDLPSATLDCWVERAELIRLNPAASITEVTSISHWPRYTLNPELAQPMIGREHIAIERIEHPLRGELFLAYRPDAPLDSPLDDGMSLGDTYLDAAMLCYVASVFGGEVEGKLLWDDGTVRHPYELD